MTDTAARTDEQMITPLWGFHLTATLDEKPVEGAWRGDVFVCSPSLRAAAEELVDRQAIFELFDGQSLTATLDSPVAAVVTALRTGLLHNVRVKITAPGSV